MFQTLSHWVGLASTAAPERLQFASWFLVCSPLPGASVKQASQINNYSVAVLISSRQPSQFYVVLPLTGFSRAVMFGAASLAALKACPREGSASGKATNAKGLFWGLHTLLDAFNISGYG